MGRFDDDGCVALRGAEKPTQWISPIFGPVGERNKLCHVHAHDGLCLDFAGAVSTPGRELIAWECNKGWNQMFVFRPGTCSLANEPPQNREMTDRVRLCVSRLPNGRLESGNCTKDNPTQRLSMT